MGSSKRFSIQVQHIVLFTIDMMKLKAFQGAPTFFQVYGIDCLEQT
jgi:hypothetical protein